MLNTAKIYTYFDLQQILKYSYLHTYIQSACLLIIHKIWAYGSRFLIITLDLKICFLMKVNTLCHKAFLI